jgi:hypothetical protein
MPFAWKYWNPPKPDWSPDLKNHTNDMENITKITQTHARSTQNGIRKAFEWAPTLPNFILSKGHLGMASNILYGI